MNTEIKIGRGLQGSDSFSVPPSFAKVSRNHATIYVEGLADGDVRATIVDNGSTNGTYVNGRRISQAPVSENDTVWLGGNGTDNHCYSLDMRSLLAPYRQAPAARAPHSVVPPVAPTGSPQYVATHRQPAAGERTDFSNEFAGLKRAYIDYHEELEKITNRSNIGQQLLRTLLSLIPMTLGVVVMLVSTDMTMRIVAMSAGSVLTGLIGTLTMGRGNKKKEKTTEAILDLQLKYQKQYCCPKCGRDYSLDLHWKKLLADGKCPYGCGARFS